MLFFGTSENLWLGLPRQISMRPVGWFEDPTFVYLGLALVAGFVIWLIFFSGNGDFKSFLSDLKGMPRETKPERFPVPVFDKSTIDLPRPPKAQRNPIIYQRSSDEIDLKLDTWAKDLRQSLREVRAESQWLVEKYKDVPLKRPKPEVKADKAKPAKKSPATKATKTQAIRTVAKKKATTSKPKAKSTSKLAQAKKPKGKA